MKHVLQTTFGKEGNCLSACISSLFGDDIDSVPFFEDDEQLWLFELSKWFFKTHNKFSILARFENLQDPKKLLNGSLCIALINSNHLNVKRHAVITKNCRIVFDPMIGGVDINLEQSMDPNFLIISNFQNSTMGRI